MTKVASSEEEATEKLKQLANRARLAYLNEKDVEYSPSAHKVYADEVKSLDAKLKAAIKAAPLERRAQLIAAKQVQLRLEEHPELENDSDALKKLRGQAIRNARNRVGSKKPTIDISAREWEAIQHGAISKTKLKQILKNCDSQKLKQRAMPRAWTKMSPGKVRRANAMAKNGYTIAQIAEALGVSTSSIKEVLKPVKN